MALRVSIGQYYSATSPIHSLDPRVKLVLTVVFMVSCFFVGNLPTLVLAGAIVGLAIALAHVPLGRLLAQIRPIVLFLVVTSVINLFFVQTGDLLVAVGPIRIFTGGVEAALLYTLRFFLLLLAGSLLMLTTQPVALTDGAEKLLAPLERLGAPVSQVTLILSIALRFVPTLSQEAKNIVAAQTARGADLENKGALAYVRACVPLLVPLFASALRHAENLGRAMDARCYTGGEGRTHYHVMRLDARHDGLAIGVMALYLVALIALTILS
ncbi:energy-coupling factor transporter transmembrane component T [Collinsella sp. An2]|uniref:energy-coupling factor transporter transmembrane component T family protein n=1 Tax=Collinsella sp. An2 TaxID=1965585 RepID=UPI000B399736|nr:energy-coupling factor transporter transmembrane component T [Collinsella sp. An2]OUP06903.1 cobalt transporter [Collinsella sp. An2]